MKGLVWALLLLSGASSMPAAERKPMVDVDAHVTWKVCPWDGSKLPD